jgi:hypothetical protein
MTVFDVNTTVSLSPFNGMFIAGIHEEDTDMGGVTTFTLGEWKVGYHYPLIPLLLWKNLLY